MPNERRWKTLIITIMIMMMMTIIPNDNNGWFLIHKEGFLCKANPLHPIKINQIEQGF